MVWKGKEKKSQEKEEKSNCEDSKSFVYIFFVFCARFYSFVVWKNNELSKINCDFDEKRKWISSCNLLSRESFRPAEIIKLLVRGKLKKLFYSGKKYINNEFGLF